MLCMKCKTIQPAAQDCNSCHVQLAAYYCDVCKLWDDDPAKPIYHCDDCGICRIGRGLGQDYFHCKKCNVCMNINFKGDHKCIERNLECDCPICGEYMFTSTTTVIFMVSLFSGSREPCDHRETLTNVPSLSCMLSPVAIAFTPSAMRTTSRRRTNARRAGRR